MKETMSILKELLECKDNDLADVELWFDTEYSPRKTKSSKVREYDDREMVAKAEISLLKLIIFKLQE